MKGATYPRRASMVATVPDESHGEPVKNAGNAARMLRKLAKLAAQVTALSGDPSVRAPLRGRYVGLIAGGPVDDAGPDRLAAIETAALALGARTARLGITLPISAGDLILLAGLYDLVCCGKTLGGLAPQMTRAGIQFVHGVLEPRDPVALLALLMAMRNRAPASAPIALACSGRASKPAVNLLIKGAALLGLQRVTCEQGIEVPGTWRLEATTGGYADWRLVAPAESPLDSHLWRAELDQQYGVALQCALMEALA